jgi:hypothetical protein
LDGVGFLTEFTEWMGCGLGLEIESYLSLTPYDKSRLKNRRSGNMGPIRKLTADGRRYTQMKIGGNGLTGFDQVGLTGRVFFRRPQGFPMFFAFNVLRLVPRGAGHRRAPGPVNGLTGLDWV